MDNSIAAPISAEAAPHLGGPSVAIRADAGAHGPAHQPAAHSRAAPVPPGEREGAGWWVATAFCAALGVAAVVLVAFGTDKDGIQQGLRATARLAFVPFWLAYAAGALASLFGPAFQPFKQRRREFGLAFAAALLVHLGLVAWLCLAGAAPGVGVFEIFGTAVVCTYLLALFSIGRLRQLSGARGWWLLRAVGMNYIAYAFAIDFLRGPLLGGVRHIVMYLPFAVLAIAGPALRLAALGRRVGHLW